MCNVYRPVGSLTAIKSHLQRNGITELHSVNELIAFQKNYPGYRQQIISEHEVIITQEKQELNLQIPRLEHSLKEQKIRLESQLRDDIDQLKQRSDFFNNSTDSLLQKLINYFKRRSLRKNINHLENQFNAKISIQLAQSIDTLTRKKNRYQFIFDHFNNAVQESAGSTLRALERKKKVIDEINSSIYGAIGEHKVAKELENLSNEYFLINDFALSFSIPVYNRQEDDYIRSIQIDHLLVSPAGIFLIETKNWSEQSLNNLSLRSPVMQIRRTNFALYKLLHGQMPNFVNIQQHHWGERKMPIKNLIVLTNHKPTEEFQYVKVITLSELLHYIKYFKPSFSGRETEAIAKYLVHLANVQHI